MSHPVRANLVCSSCGCDEVNILMDKYTCEGCGAVLSFKSQQAQKPQQEKPRNFNPQPTEAVVRRPKDLKENELPIAGCKLFFRAIFNSEKEVRTGEQCFTRKMFSGGTTPGFDTENFRYVAQNTGKSSPFAERARKGSKIMWVFLRNTPTDAQGNKESGYLLMVENGQIYDVRERPYTPIGHI